MSQLPKSLILVITLSLITISTSSTTINHRKEKLSHFRLFWHDIFNGPNASAVIIVPPPANQSNSVTNGLFGSVTMIDDPLTAGPDPNSKLLGRAQGFYAAASQKEVAALMAMNFHFVQGKYNGSTITILGRNEMLDKVREMPVIGGTGLFRFGRGYALLTTHTVNKVTGNAVVEYNLYVLHYT